MYFNKNIKKSLKQKILRNLKSNKILFLLYSENQFVLRFFGDFVDRNRAIYKKE